MISKPNTKNISSIKLKSTGRKILKDPGKSTKGNKNVVTTKTNTATTSKSKTSGPKPMLSSVSPKKIKKISKYDKLKGPSQLKQKQQKGAIYIAHLPHGFYEDSLQKFLSQFGRITRLVVARSPKTSNPMGYAHVEFLHDEVAHIVAKTMNGHLMFNKIIKCEYIPFDKIPHKKLSGGRLTPSNCPGTVKRLAMIKKLNEVRSEKVDSRRRLSIATKLKSYKDTYSNLKIDEDVDTIITEESAKLEKDLDLLKDKLEKELEKIK